jgi:hypothetical protein
MRIPQRQMLIAEYENRKDAQAEGRRLRHLSKSKDHVNFKTYPGDVGYILEAHVPYDARIPCEKCGIPLIFHGEPKRVCNLCARDEVLGKYFMKNYGD